MDAATAKRVALFASIAAGGVTAAGQIARQGKWPELTVILGTFGLAFVTSGVAEVAPKVAASAALTILATAVFAVSNDPAVVLTNLTKPRPVED